MVFYCATVGFSEIASQNIVGYTDKAVENFTFIGPAFTQVGGGETFTYADIAVNCDETGEGDGTGWQPLFDAIVSLNQNGSFVRKLVYLPQNLATELEVSKGWYDDLKVADEDFTECWNTTELEFGYGVQVSATVGANAKVTFKGEVKAAPTVTDVENFMSVANCSPVPITLNDIIVNCDETGEGDGTGWQPLFDAVVMLNQNGSFVRKLVYLPQNLATELEVSKGWYDDLKVADEDFTECWNEEVSYAPGEGFQVSATAGAGATVTIKSALAAE